MSDIKMLVMDVDGTLTDGKIYMGNEGEVFKAFDVKDGAGVALLLPDHNVIPVIITARKSQLLEKRCAELGIKELHQGCLKKIDKLFEVIESYGIELESVAYIGDDITDIPCMEQIKEATGVVMCPADAVQEVKALSDYVSYCEAGKGAVRDCINYFCKYRLEKNVNVQVNALIGLIKNKEYGSELEGTLEDGSQYVIQEYITMEEHKCSIKAHRRHIEVQYIIEGNEIVKTYGAIGLVGKGDYIETTDTETWEDGIESSCCVLVPGSVIVVMDNQPYKETIMYRKSERVKKIVCKIDA